MLFVYAWGIVMSITYLMLKRREVEVMTLKARLAFSRWHYRKLGDLAISHEAKQTRLIHEINNLCDKLARRIQDEAYSNVRR